MPLDQYGRTVTMQSNVNGFDVYTVTNPDGTCFTVSFPTGYDQPQVYNSINAMAPIQPVIGV